MPPLVETALLLQRAVTAASSAFNALFFARYRTRSRRRRVGAFALALVNLAILVQTLALGLPTQRLHLILGLVPMTAALLITALVLIQRTTTRHPRS